MGNCVSQIFQGPVENKQDTGVENKHSQKKSKENESVKTMSTKSTVSVHRMVNGILLDATKVLKMSHKQPYDPHFFYRRSTFETDIKAIIDDHCNATKAQKTLGDASIKRSSLTPVLHRINMELDMDARLERRMDGRNKVAESQSSESEYHIGTDEAVAENVEMDLMVMGKKINIKINPKDGNNDPNDLLKEIGDDFDLSRSSSNISEWNEEDISDKDYELDSFDSITASSISGNKDLNSLNSSCSPITINDMVDDEPQQDVVSLSSSRTSRIITEHDVTDTVGELLKDLDSFDAGTMRPLSIIEKKSKEDSEDAGHLLKDLDSLELNAPITNHPMVSDKECDLQSRPKTSGGFERPETRCGPAQRSVTRRGSEQRPITRRGPDERPITRRGPGERTITRRGPGRERPETRGGPEECLETRRSPEQHPVTRRVRELHPVTNQGPEERPKTRRGFPDENASQNTERFETLERVAMQQIQECEAKSISKKVKVQATYDYEDVMLMQEVVSGVASTVDKQRASCTRAKTQQNSTNKIVYDEVEVKLMHELLNDSIASKRHANSVLTFGSTSADREQKILTSDNRKLQLPSDNSGMDVRKTRRLRTEDEEADTLLQELDALGLSTMESTFDERHPKTSRGVRQDTKAERSELERPRTRRGPHLPNTQHEPSELRFPDKTAEEPPSTSHDMGTQIKNRAVRSLHAQKRQTIYSKEELRLMQEVCGDVPVVCTGATKPCDNVNALQYDEEDLRLMAEIERQHTRH